MGTETKSKILIGVTIALFVALPLMSSVLAAEGEYAELKQGQNISLRERLNRLITGLRAQLQKGAVARQFLRGADDVTIAGTVVTHAGNILVVNSNGKGLNIVLPKVWRLNSEILNVTQVLESYVKAGDTVSIKALKGQATNTQNVTLTSYLAYEISSKGYQLYAVLHSNIDTSD